ncbi:MAG: helix-turn-helix transcriptional regulator [Eubacterium sp.]|nr:helix-turn-helix transcriptional regulator [Eubacterium sp.]
MNLSVRQLEELSGVGKTTINRIENGSGNPTVEVICQLAIALNCSPHDLFYMET